MKSLTVNADSISPRSAQAKFTSLAGWRSAVGLIGVSVFGRPSATFQCRRKARGDRAVLGDHEIEVLAAE